MKKYKAILLLLLVFLVHLGVFYLTKEKPFFMDEYFHYDQISRFINHTFIINTTLMTIPGYHFFIAFVASIFRETSISFIRYISFIINLSSIPLFYKIASKIDKKGALVKTFQYSFFPIIFPFFPLIYTDISSILLILLSLFFVLRKNYILSGFFGLLSILVRQNNVIWLIFINWLLYLEEYGFYKSNKTFRGEALKTPPRCPQAPWDGGGNRLKRHVERSWVFILGILMFVVIIVFFQGLVASSYAKSYIRLSLSNLGNIYFFLFCLFFLFLPNIIYSTGKVIHFIIRKKIIIPGIFLVFAFFMLTFVNDHPFNQATFFLRNYILVFFTKTVILKGIFFLPVAYSILFLFTVRFYKKSFYLLYPFIFFYLLPYWLIEVRYYFVPFTLFILFKKRETDLVEYSTVTMYMILSGVLMTGILKQWFFL